MIYALGKKEGAYVEDDAGEDTEADVEDDEELVVGKSAENVGPVLLHAVLIEALGMGRDWTAYHDLLVGAAIAVGLLGEEADDEMDKIDDEDENNATESGQ